MSPAVHERLPGGHDTTVIAGAMVAGAMVASVLATLDVTAEHWAFADADFDLTSLFRQAADAITPRPPR
jgi:hypothetical protein